MGMPNVRVINAHLNAGQPPAHWPAIRAHFPAGEMMAAIFRSFFSKLKKNDINNDEYLFQRASWICRDREGGKTSSWKFELAMCQTFTSTAICVLASHPHTMMPSGTTLGKGL
jgi:hypothetical protein